MMTALLVLEICDMDDVLLGIVLGRLEESPLQEQAADLLLAALDGDESLLAAGNELVRMVRLSGVTIAALTPCTARAAISVPAVGASAQAAEAAEAALNKIRRATCPFREALPHRI